MGMMQPRPAFGHSFVLAVCCGRRRFVEPDRTHIMVMLTLDGFQMEHSPPFI